MSTAPQLFRFNARDHGLWLGSESVAAPPKSLALLQALLERAGCLVTREELLEAAWPGVRVTADAVRYSMRQLRLALADSATEPGFIETLPRTGWRFIGQAVQRRRCSPTFA
jgi:DNA-binding winged helix-turn-helix (wHTH) protein